MPTVTTTPSVSRASQLATFNTGRSRWTAFVFTRVIMAMLPLLSLLPEPYSLRSGLEGDVTTYFRQHNQLFSGLVPYRQFVLEYPPGALVLLVLPGTVAVTAAGYLVVWVLQSMVLDIAGYAAIKRIGKVTGSSTGAARAQWCWIVAGPLLGGLTLVRNDLLAVTAVAWAVVFLAERRPHWAGAFLGFAVLAKIWPLLVLAAVCVAVRSQRWALVRGAAIVLLAAAGALQALGMLVPMVHVLGGYHGQRGLQVESVAAYPTLIAARIHGHKPATIANFGSTNLEGHVGLVATTTYASVVVVGAMLFLGWRRQRSAPLELSAALSLAAACVGASMVTDKVLSPQYSIWLLMLVVLSVAAGNRGVRTLLCGGTFVLMTGLVYPNFYEDVVLARPIGLFLQTLRIAALLATVLSAACEGRHAPDENQTVRPVGTRLSFPRQRTSRASRPVADPVS